MSTILSSIGKAVILVNGVLVTLTGCIHVINNVLNPWCVVSETVTCFGPALRWNSGDTPFLHDSNGAGGWRSVLTTDINVVIEIWCPFVLGVLILSTASISLRQNVYPIHQLSYSWNKMATFLVLTAFFGAFGYSGNFGIMTGVVNSFSALFLLVVSVFGLHGGKFPCANESGDQSGTPLFDRVMSRRTGGGGLPSTAGGKEGNKEANKATLNNARFR